MGDVGQITRAIAELQREYDARGLPPATVLHRRRSGWWLRRKGKLVKIAQSVYAARIAIRSMK